ncbi:MAG: ABC transporter permease [Planctomycetaceae bacterium]|nr:ABC transporter permease [Planctomycetaceae bacterium]
MNQEFRQIVWKESYLVGRLVALLVGLGSLGLIAMSFEFQTGNRLGAMFGLISVLSIAAAFAIGATMFAGETEYGTEKLLQRLGVSPRSIWQGKFLVGLSGLLLLWVCLILISYFINALASLNEVSNRLASFSSVMTPQNLLIYFGLSFEALLCGIFCSCWFRRVLTALVTSVVLFLISVFVVKWIFDGFVNTRFLGGTELSLLFHCSLILLLVAANWYSISRWFSGNRRSISFSLALPRFRSNITSRYHECSPQMRFVTRIIWYELRQHGLFWGIIALLTILIDIFIVQYGPSLTLYVVPLLMGLVSCYSEQNRDRARFWYQRGASTATYWLSKNLIWLTVTGTLLLALKYGQLFLMPALFPGITLRHRAWDEFPEFMMPRMNDFPSDLWFYALLLFLLGQWSIMRVPQAIFAALLAMITSFFAIVIMNLCKGSYVPLGIALLPIIISLAFSSYWACNNALRDLVDPANRHRWRLAVFPVALMISCGMFCQYRVWSVPTYHDTSLDDVGEVLLMSSDEDYSEKYLELVNSFPRNREMSLLVSKRVEKERKDQRVPNTIITDSTKALFSEIYSEEIAEQKAPLLEIANLLESRYQSNQPLQINLLKYWRPQPDLNTPIEESYDLFPADRQLFRLLQNGYYHGEYPFPLTPADMIRFLWNIDEVHSHLNKPNDLMIALPNSYMDDLGVLSPKNMSRLLDQESAQSLRELAKESVSRETRITPLRQMTQKWFTYANYQIKHDNELFWKLVSRNSRNAFGIPVLENEPYLLDSVMNSSRWTILPTEKTRAKRLLDRPAMFYSILASRYDKSLENEIPINTIYEYFWNTIRTQFRNEESTRLYESTPAVRDLVQRKTMQHFETYVNLISGHRKRTTLFAILAFAKENERYPEKLEELVPEYLAKLPVAPWTAKPFGYIGPSFKGKVYLRSGYAHELTYPILWSSGESELELTNIAADSQPSHYIFASRKQYRQQMFATGFHSRVNKSFKATAELVEQNVSVMQLPALQDKDQKQE